MTHRNPGPSALELPGRVPLLSRLDECRSRYPARRRYAQQPSSLRTAHDARGKYGSEIYAAASYGSMGILEKNKPHAPSPRATLLDAGEKAATCLAPLVRTSNASPPAFLEGCCLRNPRSSSWGAQQLMASYPAERATTTVLVLEQPSDAGIAEQYRASQTRRACAIIRRAQPGRANALRRQKE